MWAHCGRECTVHVIPARLMANYYQNLSRLPSDYCDVCVNKKKKRFWQTGYLLVRDTEYRRRSPSERWRTNFADALYKILRGKSSTFLMMYVWLITHINNHNKENLFEKKKSYIVFSRRGFWLTEQNLQTSRSCEKESYGFRLGCLNNNKKPDCYDCCKILWQS